LKECDQTLGGFHGSESPNENKVSYRRNWQPACCEASRMDDSGAD
jgi:hypothetical protein